MGAERHGSAGTPDDSGPVPVRQQHSSERASYDHGGGGGREDRGFYTDRRHVLQCTVSDRPDPFPKSRQFASLPKTLHRPGGGRR